MTAPVTCDTFEMALAGGDAAEIALARAHAATCARCAETLELWDDISAAAKTLRREWPSPSLWPEIERGLEVSRISRPSRIVSQARSAVVPLAAAAALVLVTAGGWWYL